MTDELRIISARLDYADYHDEDELPDGLADRITFKVIVDTDTNEIIDVIDEDIG